MKSIIAILVLSVFAQAQTQPVPVPVEDPVRGHWVIESRVCSSGVEPRDAFIIGKDELTVSFFNGKYDTHTRIERCNYWATGDYNTQGNMLRVFNVTGGSNCTTQQPAREGSVVFNSVNGKLKLFMGPYGYGGSCPSRDLLESTFRAL